MRRALRVLWLIVLWLLLWRDLSVANVASGLAVAVLVETSLTLAWAGPGRAHRLRPLALLRFATYFAWKLVEANVYLAREVLTPRNRIETGIIAVPLTGCSSFVATVVANAVSLTPGTLTVDVHNGETVELFVHVLHLHHIEAARNDVLEFTRRAQAAFPSTSTDRSRS